MHENGSVVGKGWFGKDNKMRVYGRSGDIIIASEGNTVLAHSEDVTNKGKGEVAQRRSNGDGTIRIY